MATSTQTQPSSVAREPTSPPHYGEEPESRIAQDKIPYRGPSNLNHKGRFRLMLGVLGVILLLSVGLTVRLLTDRGLDDSPAPREELGNQNSPAK